jgi:hypothetical protein
VVTASQLTAPAAHPVQGEAGAGTQVKRDTPGPQSVRGTLHPAPTQASLSQPTKGEGEKQGKERALEPTQVEQPLRYMNLKTHAPYLPHSPRAPLSLPTGERGLADRALVRDREVTYFAQLRGRFSRPTVNLLVYPSSEVSEAGQGSAHVCWYPASCGP